MTEKEIMEYRSLIKLIERKEADIEKLKEKDIDIVCGKVKGSSREFPYTEIRTSVQMYDPKQNEIILNRMRECKKIVEESKKKIDEITTFISSINDPEMKVIFEMRVYDGMNWYDIATEIETDKDRTTYSKKFKKYLENSHNSRISQ